MRRFQVVVSTSASILEDQVLSISENMFVHNNSKHGKRTKRVPIGVDDQATDRILPQIVAVNPQEGSIYGNEVVTIIGENFSSDITVVFWWCCYLSTFY